MILLLLVAEIIKLTVGDAIEYLQTSTDMVIYHFLGGASWVWLIVWWARHVLYFRKKGVFGYSWAFTRLKRQCSYEEPQERIEALFVRAMQNKLSGNRVMVEWVGCLFCMRLTWAWFQNPYDPLSSPGVIPEHKARGKPWALLNVGPTNLSELENFAWLIRRFLFY